MRFIILLLSFSLSASAQDHQIPESCMEYLMGGSIDYVLEDSTIDLLELASDTIFYRFRFGQESELPCVFLDYGMQGAPLIDIDVKNGIIEKIFFNYLSVGHIYITDEAVDDLLSSHFCIYEPLIPYEQYGLSNCSFTRHGIKISATHIWKAKLEDHVTIEYTFLPENR